MQKTNKPIYKIPEREWYNLEQAVKYIQFKTGYPIEIADLWHYFYTGKLAINVCININENRMRIADLDISRSYFHFIENPIVTISDEGLNVTQKEDFEDVKIDKIFEKITWNKEEKEYSGFLTVFPAIENYTFIENDLIRDGLKITFCQQLMIPRVKKYNEVKVFFLQFEENENFNPFKTYLKPKDIYILHEQLEQFLLNDSEEFQRITKEVKKLADRPTNPHKELILSLGKINAKHYPTASANLLAKNIKAHLISTGKKENEIITETEILRKFRANNIGAPKKQQDRKLVITKIYTE